MHTRRAVRIVRRQVEYGYLARLAARPNGFLQVRQHSDAASISSFNHDRDIQHEPERVARPSLISEPEAPVTADNPYAAFDELNRKGPFSEVLDALPPDAWTSETFWTVGRLGFFTRRKLIDTDGMVRLFHVFPGILDNMPFHEAVKVLCRVLVWAGHTYALVLLPPTVDMIQGFMDRRMARPGGIDSHSLQMAYKAVFDKLDPFRPSMQHRERQPTRAATPIRAQAIRLARHLFEKLDQLPSTSTVRPYLEDEVIAVLLGGPLACSDLRHVVLRHMSSTSQQPTRGQYHHCMVQANREGQSDLAKAFAAKKLALPDDGTVSEKIPDDLLLPKSHIWPNEVIDIVEPYLRLVEDDVKETLYDYFERPKSKVELAWSNFLHRAAADIHGISANHLAILESEVPSVAVCSSVMTPLMRGFALRDQRLDSWRIWRSLEEHQNGDHETSRSRFVDTVALATATEVCGQLFDLETAVALVDHWAARSRAVRNAPRLPVSLDAQNLNVLLNLCRVEGKAGLAFRLFAVARGRWQIFPDEVSLALLFDTAKRHQLMHGHEAELAIGRRLTSLMSELTRRRVGRLEDRGHALDVFDGGDPAKDDLLVSLRNTWTNEHGFVEPWEKARRLFHEVIFGNLPNLAKCKSPLQLTGAGPLQYFTSLFGSRIATGSISPGLPLTTARYLHLVPSAATFHRYISLIGYFGRASEIPLVLAWMRALGVRPSFFCLNTALVHVGEAEGPVRRIARWKEDGGSAWVRDEQVLRKWLEDWLGTRGPYVLGQRRWRKIRTVPSEWDTRRYRKHLFATNQNLTSNQ